MRDKIIGMLELLIWIMAALIAVAGLVSGLGMIAGGQALPGIAFIIGGALYAVLFAGMFFIMKGIYDNTKRTAEAVEKLANK